VALYADVQACYFLGQVWLSKDTASAFLECAEVDDSIGLIFGDGFDPFVDLALIYGPLRDPSCRTLRGFLRMCGYRA
jgi:hypothetical protein